MSVGNVPRFLLESRINNGNALGDATIVITIVIYFDMFSPFQVGLEAHLMTPLLVEPESYSDVSDLQHHHYRHY